MTRTLTLYQGADMDPEWDYSDWVEWPDCEFGTRCNNGEATQGELRIRDVSGETGNFANLPGGLTYRGISAHNVITLTEDASGSEKHIYRGWIIPKDYTRGVQKAFRAREVRASIEDLNCELRGIIVGRDAVESRPVETDVARVLWLLNDYFDGSVRAATVIGDAFVPNTNTVSMPAKQYEDVTPEDVLRDCATSADKRFWVILNDDGTMDLFYDTIDSSAYASTLEIRQSGDPTEIDGTTTFEPIWDVGPASREDGSRLLSGVKVKGSDPIAAYVNDATTVSEYNHFEEVLYDDLIATQAEAEAKANSILAVRKFEERTYSCSILVPADRIHLIKAGMNITIQAKVISDADDQIVTRRIGQLKFRIHNNDLYKVMLQLDRPLRVAPFGKGTKPGPKPPAQPVAGTCTRLYFSSNDPSIDAAVDVAWEVDSRLPAGQTKTLTTTPDSTYTSSTNHTDSSAGNGSDICLWQGAISMSAGLAAVIAAGGGTIQAQLLARARSGIGISEASQNMISQIGVRVTQGATTTIRGTALNLHNLASSVGSTKWPAQTTKVNRIFPPAAAGNVLSAVSGAVAGDFLIVEVGMRNFTAVSTGGTVGSISAGGTDLPEDEVSTSLLNHWIDICTAGTAGGSTSPIVPPGQGSPGTDTGTYSPIDHEHEHYVDGEGFQHDAVDLDYDPTTSGLEAGNVQEAIDALAAGAGASTVVDHGSMGATETFDFLEGTDHEGVLSADLTATLTGATNGEAAFVTLKLTQDGTGGWDITWPGSVEWPGGVAPTFDTTAGSVSIVNLFSYDGGTIWYGFLAGGSSVGALDDLSDVTITAPSVDEVLTYDGAEWVNQASTGGASQHILLADGRPTPFTFDDLLQMDDGSDFMWSDPA